MKLPILTLTVLLAGMLVWAGDETGTNTNSTPKTVLPLTNNFTIITNFNLGLMPFTNLPPVNGPLFMDTNGVWRFRPAPLVRDLTPSTQEFPKPGIYETAPYSMIVVVPGSCDDKFIIRGRDLSPRMPVAKPELQFIPRPHAGR